MSVASICKSIPCFGRQLIVAPLVHLLVINTKVAEID